LGRLNQLAVNGGDDTGFHDFGISQSMLKDATPDSTTLACTERENGLWIMPKNF